MSDNSMGYIYDDTFDAVDQINQGLIGDADRSDILVSDSLEEIGKDMDSKANYTSNRKSCKKAYRKSYKKAYIKTDNRTDSGRLSLTSSVDKIGKRDLSSHKETVFSLINHFGGFKKDGEIKEDKKIEVLSTGTKALSSFGKFMC